MNGSLVTSRRQWLNQTACGFGGLALAGLAHKNAAGVETGAIGSHFAPRIKRVIFLFMQGGPSHVDTFDHKPILEKRDGESYDFSDDRVRAKTGKKTSAHRIMKSPWAFRRHGDSGQWASELFEQTAKNHMDSLCMIRSMHTEGVAHGPATLFLHCGSTNFVRPSMGSWITYGLGSENDNLPGFVTINPAAGNGGPRNYGNAFLPSRFQGTAVGDPTSAEIGMRNLKHPSQSFAEGRRQLELTQALNSHQLALHGGDEPVVLGLPNRGAVPWAPDDAIVELPTDVMAGGQLRRHPAVTLPDAATGLLARHARYETSTARALAGTRSREDVRERPSELIPALAANPMVSTEDLAERLVDEILDRSPS